MTYVVPHLMFRLLFAVSIVLKILMFRDAVKRGVPTIWFWLIAFMPAGEVVYFFVFMVDGLLKRAGRRRMSGWSAERKAPVTAGAKKGLAHAEELYDDGRYAQAEGVLEQVLEDEPSHPDALYLLAMARMQLEDPGRAVEPLQRLVDVKAGHRNYAGWLLLAKAHEDSGDPAASRTELERLVDRSPRLKHHVLLAELLMRLGETEEATDVLLRCRTRKGDDEWQERRDNLRAQLA